jgi:hypothetical protein
MLRVTGSHHALTRQWAEVLARVVIRHPNRAIDVTLDLEDDVYPNLTFGLSTNLDSETDAVIAPFPITNVRLTFFPGERLAHQWLAAAWGCFMQHEALELVTAGDAKARVLCPHAQRPWLDHMFHRGFPFRLTPESMLAALATAIPLDDARALVAQEAT